MRSVRARPRRRRGWRERGPGGSRRPGRAERALAGLEMRSGKVVPARSTDPAGAEPDVSGAPRRPPAGAARGGKVLRAGGGERTSARPSPKSAAPPSPAPQTVPGPAWVSPCKRSGARECPRPQRARLHISHPSRRPPVPPAQSPPRSGCRVRPSPAFCALRCAGWCCLARGPQTRARDPRTLRSSRSLNGDPSSWEPGSSGKRNQLGEREGASLPQPSRLCGTQECGVGVGTER